MALILTVIFLLLAGPVGAEELNTTLPMTLNDCRPPNCVQFALPDLQPGESVSIDVGVRSVPQTGEIHPCGENLPMHCDTSPRTLSAVTEDPRSVVELAYREYKSYAIYQEALFREMCLAWYVMQQPKNHGILQSHGAPNF